MKLRSSVFALALAGALLLATTALALAWPDLPPDKATISGPGIKGTVQITDKQVLEVLKLGTIEDFAHGYATAPNVADGYKITRYFDKGEFDFARLTYYPMTNGRSYLYWEDGPQLEGDHTEYNQKWLYATVTGDAVLKHFLDNLGVSYTGAEVAASDSVASNSIKSTSNATSSVAPTATSPQASTLAVAAGGVGIISLLGGLLIWMRRRPRAQ